MKPIEAAKIYRLFYPVVPVVVTASHKGETGGLAAISYISLSFKPPLVGVSIHPKSRTHRLVRDSREFAMNWLDYMDREKILKMGETTGAEVKDKLKASGLTTAPARAIGAPVLGEAVAVVECRLKDTYPTGDHELFVGECLSAYAVDDFDEYWRFRKYSAALYVGSGRAEKFASMTLP